MIKPSSIQRVMFSSCSPFSCTKKKSKIIFAMVLTSLNVLSSLSLFTFISKCMMELSLSDVFISLKNYPSRKPSGNSSFGSRIQVANPWIQALPVTFGMTAGKPATVVSPTISHVKQEPMMLSWTKLSPTFNFPLLYNTADFCRGARAAR